MRNTLVSIIKKKKVVNPEASALETFEWLLKEKQWMSMSKFHQSQFPALKMASEIEAMMFEHRERKKSGNIKPPSMEQGRTTDMGQLETDIDQVVNA